MAAIEQGGRDRDRRLEAIEEGVRELKNLLVEHGQAFARFTAQQQTQHTADQQQQAAHRIADQAAIAAQQSRLNDLAPTVERIEKERQQLKGAQKLMKVVWLPIAAIGGYAADKFIDLLKGHP